MLTVRIDERLIHSQIIAGWIDILHLQHIIVASDAAAIDSSHIMAMQLATPPSVKCTVCYPDEVAHHVQQFPISINQLIIAGSVNCARCIIQMLADIKEVNLANCGCQPGVSHGFKLTASVFLTKKECDIMFTLCQQGITVIYQPSPWMPIQRLPAEEFNLTLAEHHKIQHITNN